jgi:hypothetical protein
MSEVVAGITLSETAVVVTVNLLVMKILDTEITVVVPLDKLARMLKGIITHRESR